MRSPGFILGLHRNRGLIGLQVMTLLNFPLENIVKGLQQAARGRKPVVQGRFRQMNALFPLKDLRLAVQREVVHILTAHYVSQQTGTGIARGDRKRGKISNDDFSGFPIQKLRAGLLHHIQPTRFIGQVFVDRLSDLFHAGNILFGQYNLFFTWKVSRNRLACMSLFIGLITGVGDFLLLWLHNRSLIKPQVQCQL